MYDEDKPAVGKVHTGAPKGAVVSVSKGSPKSAGTVAEGAPKMSENDSDDKQFPWIDDDMDKSDFIHFHPVPSVNCHNKLEGRVPLVNLSVYSISMFTFCYSDSFMSLL